jgi:hypothetical protein
METLVLLCTIVVCAFLGVLLGGVFLFGFLGLVSRMVAPSTE